jgi:hypothetical protein
MEVCLLTDLIGAYQNPFLQHYCDKRSLLVALQVLETQQIFDPIPHVGLPFHGSDEL